MIIPFLIKHFRTILDALIIAAIMVAFAFFDPFHLFTSKVNIRNTQVAVESIRQIGQLITAEYYGETIASLPQTLTDTITDEQIINEAQSLFNELLSAVNNLKALSQGKKPALKVKEKNIENTFLDSNAWLARNRFYPFIIKYLAGYLDIKQTKNYTEKVLWKIYISNSTDIKFFPTKFLKEISDKNRKAYQEIKKNIVYIGRGWVKAGIDFENLKASDISYSTENKTIYIKNCETRILDCDINPWFIPGKVKGYELIKEKGSFENPFAEAVKVKKRCVENLRVQAIKSGILEQAHQNAKETLKRLIQFTDKQRDQGSCFYNQQI